MQDLLADSVTALFADHATPAAVRHAEQHGLDRALWKLVADAGFDKALAPEGVGGSALGLSDVASVLYACGRYAPPIPLGEATMAHAFAGANGVGLPEGIVTASLVRVDGDRAYASAVPWGDGADWVLAVVPHGPAFVFAAARAESAPHAGLRVARETDMVFRLDDAHSAFTPAPPAQWRSAGAALRACQIAGALDSVLEITTRYAGERSQFGRTLAKFQAIQQQIALLAEDTVAARMAGALACDARGALPKAANAAAAKVVASEAAARACGIAHAVHGAMGVTQEYDLQLFTRRLLAWRMQYGSENYWAGQVGRALLDDRRTVWEFVREPTAAHERRA